MFVLLLRGCPQASPLINPGTRAITRGESDGAGPQGASAQDASSFFRQAPTLHGNTVGGAPSGNNPQRQVMVYHQTVSRKFVLDAAVHRVNAPHTHTHTHTHSLTQPSASHQTTCGRHSCTASANGLSHPHVRRLNCTGSAWHSGSLRARTYECMFRGLCCPPRSKWCVALYLAVCLLRLDRCVACVRLYLSSATGSGTAVCARDLVATQCNLPRASRCLRWPKRSSSDLWTACAIAVVRITWVRFARCAT